MGSSFIHVSIRVLTVLTMSWAIRFVHLQSSYWNIFPIIGLILLSQDLGSESAFFNGRKKEGSHFLV